jgi:RNA polymerase sigma factor (sigma-70 family)
VNATADLVTAAGTGDEQAWGELVDRFAPLVHSVIRSYGLNRADAADVNQTVWLRLVEHLSRLREPTALAGWLATTTRHECYRLLRLGRRTQPFDPHDESVDAHVAASLLVDPATPDERLLRAERRQVLREGLAQLPSRCRDLLSLLAADPPVSYREIGERLGMPIGSVGPTQARCLRKLRDCPALAGYLSARSRGPSPGSTGGPPRQVARSDDEAEPDGGERDGVMAAGW